MAVSSHADCQGVKVSPLLAVVARQVYRSGLPLSRGGTPIKEGDRMDTAVRSFDPERMKAARKSASMSQRDLADVSGIPVNMIREYEQGKSIPSVPRLFIIADTLRCGADDLAS